MIGLAGSLDGLLPDGFVAGNTRHYVMRWVVLRSCGESDDKHGHFYQQSKRACLRHPTKEGDREKGSPGKRVRKAHPYVCTHRPHLLHTRWLLDVWRSTAFQIHFIANTPWPFFPLDILMVNKQGQTRIAQYYSYMELDERTAMEGEIIRKCLARTETQVK